MDDTDLDDEYDFVEETEDYIVEGDWNLPEMCPHCGGSGTVLGLLGYAYNDNDDGEYPDDNVYEDYGLVTCDRCDGQGQIYE